MLPFGQDSGSFYILAPLSNGSSFVTRISLYGGYFLAVLPLKYPYTSKFSGSHEVAEKLHLIIGVLYNFHTFIHGFLDFGNGASSLTNGQSHVSIFDQEGEFAVFFIHQTIFDGGPGHTLEQGNVPYLVCSEFDGHKNYPINSSIVESPGSEMIMVATVKGLPHTEPRSTLVPS